MPPRWPEVAEDGAGENAEGVGSGHGLDGGEFALGQGVGLVAGVFAGNGRAGGADYYGFRAGGDAEIDGEVGLILNVADLFGEAGGEDLELERG